MKKNPYTKRSIAPCGINCGTCLAYMREKKPCLGCWSDDHHKPKHCINCAIKNCEHLAQTKSKFCYECPKFPCVRLKRLDKRYIFNYHMSMLENLRTIQVVGLSGYIKNEAVRWRCNSCNSMLCVHRKACPSCNKERIDTFKN